jgi:hypothetical protein
MFGAKAREQQSTHDVAMGSVGSQYQVIRPDVGQAARDIQDLSYYIDHGKKDSPEAQAVIARLDNFARTAPYAAMPKPPAQAGNTAAASQAGDSPAQPQQPNSAPQGQPQQNGNQPTSQGQQQPQQSNRVDATNQQSIDNAPPGAEIYVNGRHVGTKPAKQQQPSAPPQAPAAGGPTQ